MKNFAEIVKDFVSQIETVCNNTSEGKQAAKEYNLYKEAIENLEKNIQSDLDSMSEKKKEYFGSIVEKIKQSSNDLEKKYDDIQSVFKKLQTHFKKWYENCINYINFMYTDADKASLDTIKKLQKEAKETKAVYSKLLKDIKNLKDDALAATAKENQNSVVQVITEMNAKEKELTISRERKEMYLKWFVIYANLLPELIKANKGKQINTEDIEKFLMQRRESFSFNNNFLKEKNIKTPNTKEESDKQLDSIKQEEIKEFAKKLSVPLDPSTEDEFAKLFNIRYNDLLDIYNNILSFNFDAENKYFNDKNEFDFNKFYSSLGITIDEKIIIDTSKAYDKGVKLSKQEGQVFIPYFSKDYVRSVSVNTNIIRLRDDFYSTGLIFDPNDYNKYTIVDSNNDSKTLETTLIDKLILYFALYINLFLIVDDINNEKKAFNEFIAFNNPGSLQYSLQEIHDNYNILIEADNKDEYIDEHWEEIFGTIEMSQEEKQKKAIKFFKKITEENFNDVSEFVKEAVKQIVQGDINATDGEWMNLAKPLDTTPFDIIPGFPFQKGETAYSVQVIDTFNDNDDTAKAFLSNKSNARTRVVKNILEKESFLKDNKNLLKHLKSKIKRNLTSFFNNCCEDTLTGDISTAFSRYFKIIKEAAQEKK